MLHSPSAKSSGGTDQPIVFVVDDDASMGQALARLFHSVQLQVEVFASAQEFLRGTRPDVPSCLVLDVRLPGLSGLDFQAELIKADVRIPIVFITGHGDISMTVRAMFDGTANPIPILPPEGESICELMPTSSLAVLTSAPPEFP